MNSEYTKATGKILCNNIPLKYVKVSLIDYDYPLWDETFGTSTTDINGNFEISGSATDVSGWDYPDPYLKIEYIYTSSTYGNLDIKDVYTVLSTAYDTTSIVSFSSLITFGTINLNNEKCKTYLNMLSAINDYYSRTLLKLPMTTLNIHLNQILAAGVPYTAYQTINVPIGWNNSNGLDYATSKHELAHAIRHTYDGDEYHFLADVATYNYLQHHNCNSNTNLGYAFNEGWAAFWEGSCLTNTGSIYTIEGNVAYGLRRLKTKCISSDKKFINVLKSYPGQIHSFDDFNNKHYLTYGCKL